MRFDGIARVLYAASGWAPFLLGMAGAAAWIAVVAQAGFAPLPTTLLMYLVLVCAWPWPPDRFMVPVLFFLLAMLLGLVSCVGRRLGAAGRLGAIAVSALAIVGATSNARTLADYVAVNIPAAST